MHSLDVTRLLDSRRARLAEGYEGLAGEREREDGGKEEMSSRMIGAQSGMSRRISSIAGCACVCIVVQIPLQFPLRVMLD